jgi:hypothetical protein
MSRAVVMFRPNKVHLDFDNFFIQDWCLPNEPTAILIQLWEFVECGESYLSRCRRNNLINCQKAILQGGRCFCSSSVHCVENLGGKVLILQIVRWKQNWILECLSSWGCRREKVERDFLKSKSLVGVLNYGLVQTSKAWRTAKPVGFRITWCPFLLA